MCQNLFNGCGITSRFGMFGLTFYRVRGYDLRLNYINLVQIISVH